MSLILWNVVADVKWTCTSHVPTWILILLDKFSCFGMIVNYIYVIKTATVGK
jgi:hypothetical protein